MAETAVRGYNVPQKSETVSHGNVVLQKLHRCQNEGRYSDTVVTVEGIQYNCHTVVLASMSDYFDQLFNSEFPDSKAPEISSKEVGAVFPDVLTYMYTGEIECTLQNAYNLLIASDYLQMKELKEFCVKFIKENPCVENALKIYGFAASPAGDPEFAKIAIDIIATNLPEISKTAEFLEIDFELFREIFLRRPAMDMDCKFCGGKIAQRPYMGREWHCNQCDKMYDSSEIPRENYLIPIIYDWIKYDIRGRFKYFAKLAGFTGHSNIFEKKLESLISEYTAKVTFQQSIHIYVWAEEDVIVNFIYDNNDKSWKIFDNLKLTFTFVKGLAVREKLYFLTSKWFDEKTIVNKFWVDEKKDQWRELQSPPVFSNNYKMACIGSTIYLYMYDENPVRNYTAYSYVNFEEEIGPHNIYTYVVDLNKWFTLPPIPRFLFNSYFVAANDELFVIGGSTSPSLPVEHDTVVKITQSFDPRTSQWSEREFDLDLNFKGRACSYGSEIFICEMRNGDTIKVFIYDVISKNWETTMMHDKGIFSVDAVAVHGSHLWIVLSTDVGCSVKTYHLKTKVWNSLPCIPSSVKVDGVDCRVFGIFDALVF